MVACQATSMTAALFEPTRREFPQERARKTYEALIEAADQAFAERGFDATQTPDIAARADVSVGTFYRYFEDKLEILLEVVRRELTSAHERILSKLTVDLFAQKNRRQSIESVLKVLLEQVNRRPGMQRVYYEMAFREPRVLELKQAFDAEGRRVIAGLIRAVCPEEDVSDPEATAYIIQTATLECALAIAGERGPLPVSRQRSLTALTDVVTRSLFGIDRQ